MLAFEKEETDAEIGAVDASKEVGESLEVRFDGHEDVERILSSTEILLKGEAEEI